MRANEYIRDLAANGSYHFTTADAIKAIEGKPPAVRAQLRAAVLHPGGDGA